MEVTLKLTLLEYYQKEIWLYTSVLHDKHS